MSHTQTFLVFSFCLLLFMQSLAILESAPTSTNGNFTNSKKLTKRAASTIPEAGLWPDALIPYEMMSSLEPQRCLIESAMMHIMLQSCVLFRPIQDQEDIMRPTLSIVKPNRNKCSATMGVNRYSYGGSMYLGPARCFNIGVILHELMHVLGFHHEHQRSDRDQYLQINYNNFKNNGLIPRYEKNDRSSESYFPQFDLDSITIYGNVSGSKDHKLKTIESKVPGKEAVAEKDKLNLSPLDVKSINELYKCPLVDNRACEKVALLADYIFKCTAEARKYIKLSLMKKLTDLCK